MLNVCLISETDNAVLTWPDSLYVPSPLATLTTTLTVAGGTGLMADLGGGLLEPGGGQREELKTQFMTREGTYQLMSLAEYTRPNRVGYNNQPTNCSAPVKVSLVLSKARHSPLTQVSFVNSECDETAGETLAFNYGRELFVYPYRGVRKAADLTKPLDKRVYKGTWPTCHDFGPPGCLKNENVRFYRF